MRPNPSSMIRGVAAAVLFAACAREPSAPTSGVRGPATDAASGIASCAPNCVLYTVSPLLPAGLSGAATSINDYGSIVGSAYVGGIEHAFYTPDATVPVTILPMMAGATGCHAWDVSDYGTVVGVCVVGGSSRAFRWSGRTGLKELPRPTSAYTSAAALGINDAGFVVGVGEDGAGTLRAIRWDPAGAPMLITPSGSLSSTATVIDDAGNIAGMRTHLGSWDTAYWPARTRLPSWGVHIDAQVTPTGATWALPGGYLIVGWYTGCTPAGCVTLTLNPYDVSDKGKIVGRAPNGGAAYQYSVSGAVHMLPSYGSGDAEARGVNTCGTIVGFSSGTPVVWTKSTCD